MTNREILAELKISYENLTDIIENEYNQINQIIQDYLLLSQGYVRDAYIEFYSTLDKEELLVENDYISCYISDLPEFDYTYYDIDGKTKLYDITCADADYFWYQDKKYLHENIELNSKRDLVEL